MKHAERRAVWDTLCRNGIVSGEPPVPDEAGSPWFVHLMQGIAAWIGAAFILMSIWSLMAFVIKSAALTFLLGVAGCMSTGLIFRADRKGTFIGQFGLAISFSGQVLMFYALYKWAPQSLALSALIVAIVQGVLFWLLPNFIHRVFSAWAGLQALLIAIPAFSPDLGYFTGALLMAGFFALWLREFDFTRHGELIRAAGYGMAFMLFNPLNMMSVMPSRLLTSGMPIDGKLLMSREIAYWLGQGALAAAALWGAALLLRREHIGIDSRTGWLTLAATALVAIVNTKVPGLAFAAAIFILGHANGNRVLLGFGILALLANLSRYYYLLHASLLGKSMLLVCAGGVLLLARLALHRLPAVTPLVTSVTSVTSAPPAPSENGHA